MERPFAKAYNARSVQAMAALLAPDATTELVGSGFPPEQGAGAIREGSFAHLLEGQGLAASAIEVEGTAYVAFREADGTLDSLAALTTQDGTITRLRYHTRWHDAAFVEGVGA